MKNDETLYLVLGGRGFIGSHLIEALLARGYRVRSFDRIDSRPSEFESTFPDQFEFFPGDFSNETDIVNAIKGCHICFHLVCTTLPKSSNADPIFDVESNLVGTIRLLQHAVDVKLNKLVFISSGGTVYGTPQYSPLDELHPTSPICSYGITKLAIEKYLDMFNQLYNLDYCVLRLSNPYGERQRTNSGQGAVAVFSSKAVRGEPIEIWGDGTVVRDYVHVRDAAAALVAAAEYKGTQKIFNIGSGVGTSTNELIDTIEGCMGHLIKRDYMPGRAFDVPENVLNINLAKEELKWAPSISFKQGLADLLDWLSAEARR